MRTATNPHWYDRGLRTPEPDRAVIRAVADRAIATEMAKEAQVWFWGAGPDNALAFEWEAYLRWLTKKGSDWLRLGAAAIQIRPKQAGARVAHYHGQIYAAPVCR